MKQYLWIMASLIFATTLPIQTSASTSLTSTSPPTQSSPKIILAKVNGQPIYQYQLESQIQAELRKYQKLTNKQTLSQEIKNKIQNKILQYYINAELIHQASQKYPVKNIEKKVAQYIQRAKENNQPIHSKEAIKRQIRINEYLKAQDLISPQPTEDEVRAFYEKGKEQFKSTQDSVHIRHIFVNKKNKEQINKAYQKLKKGEPFNKIAQQYSEDETSKEKGGDLGFILKGYMPKPVEEVAFQAQGPMLSNIIETEEGYHIIKVLEVRPAGSIIPYEKMKDFLKRGLASKTKEARVTAHLEKLKRNATIEIVTQTTSN